MGLFGELTLSGVRRLERSLGPKAALAALLPLLDGMPGGPDRARAVLFAISLAREAKDEGAALVATSRWGLYGVDAVAPEARALGRMLLASGEAELAANLARAELDRLEVPSPAARYRLARCLEAMGAREEAALIYQDLTPAEAPVGPAAATRSLRLKLARGEDEAAAEDAKRALECETLPPADRVAAAIARLRSPGRYARASALDVLASHAPGRDEIANAARLAAAGHAERLGAEASEIELDRVAAVLTELPDPVARATALAELEALARLASAPEEDREARAIGAASTSEETRAHLARAKRVAAGEIPGPRPEGARAKVGWHALEALAALAHGEPERANTALAALAHELESGARIEAVVWVAAERGLRSKRSRRAALALAARLLEGADEPPPRGSMRFAAALERAGDVTLSRRALELATSRRESGASRALGERLRAEGWAAAEAGERERARALLRRARSLLGG